MADRQQRHPSDRGGDWFVDTTCIDCDVARQLAPGLIGEASDGRSYFHRPPADPSETLQAWRALLACPTGSIGAPKGATLPSDAFPFEVAPDVFLTGYNSESSFGANAYFVRSTDGHFLVDSPRWVPRLADAFERMGGVKHILLTHRDDVADYEQYARRFGARTWIHRDDADAAPEATDVFSDDTTIDLGLRAIPVPGHTEGSAVYVWKDRFLFTGDSLAWSRKTNDLYAFADATWYSWEAQAESLARLADDTVFEWVLPGHGGRGHASVADMRRRLKALAERMRRGRTAATW
jgi:glyoxylase-like metal-dependent hydrolase (beta-lactamase superfamily II)